MLSFCECDLEKKVLKVNDLEFPITTSAINEAKLQECSNCRQSASCIDPCVALKRTAGFIMCNRVEHMLKREIDILCFSNIK